MEGCAEDGNGKSRISSFLNFGWWRFGRSRSTLVGCRMSKLPDSINEQ